MKPQQQTDNLSPLRRSLFGDSPYVSNKIAVGTSALAARLAARGSAGSDEIAATAEAASEAHARLRARAIASAGTFVAARELNRTKTPPIPMPDSHIPRTSSEMELTEEMAAADYREKVMFHRLVSGMRERAVELSRRNQPNQGWSGAVEIPHLPQPHHHQPTDQNQRGCCWNDEEDVPPQARQPSSSLNRQRHHHHHAEVLKEALRLTDDATAETESMTEAAREAFASSGRAAAPREQEQAEEASAVQQQQRRQYLADVLDKVANEDWSIEGYEHDHYSFGCGDQAQQQHGGGGYGLPQFPLLPPAAAVGGGGGCGGAPASMVIQPSPTVPTCCAGGLHDDDDDMVFSMDL